MTKYEENTSKYENFEENANETQGHKKVHLSATNLCKRHFFKFCLERGVPALRRQAWKG